MKEFYQLKRERKYQEIPATFHTIYKGKFNIQEFLGTGNFVITESLI